MPTAPAALLPRPSTRPATRPPARPKRIRRSNASIYVVLPGPGDVARGNEGGVPLGPRPEERVFEDVPALVDVGLLRAEQLVRARCRRL